MQFDRFANPTLFLLMGTTLILVLAQDWRISISSLGVQYIGVFFLIGLTWPLELAVIKLVAGWIAAAVLGMGLVNISMDQTFQEKNPISGQVFKLILVVLVGLAILSFSPTVARWLLHPSYAQILGGLLLAGMGLLHLGLSDHPIRVAIGLLTFFSGFEIIYATLETSPFVTGMLAVVSLGIALIGSYVFMAPTIEGEK